MNFELQIKTPNDVPIIGNFTELKEQLENTLSDYSNRVYTEETISEAKADRAKLNKLKKALNDERISREKAYLAPFMDFKGQVKELTDMIDSVSSGLGEQIDKAEEYRIARKRGEIEILFDEIKSNYDCNFVRLEGIYKSSWNNKSVSMSDITNDITEIFEKATRDLDTIRSLPNSFEIEESYKNSLDLNAAIAVGNHIADVNLKKRQDALQKAQEQIAKDGEEKFNVAFKCEITRSQALELSEWCKDHGIKLIKI